MTGGRAPRDGKGRWIRGVESAERDGEAMRLRSLGWTLQKIADHLGYGNPSHAKRSIDAALALIPSEGAAEMRKVMDLKLDRLERKLWRLANRRYPALFQGVQVEIDGVPQWDSGPVRGALNDLAQVYRDRRKLHGLDVPVRQEIAAETVVRYEIAGVDLSKLT